jgi:hypothetical protein
MPKKVEFATEGVTVHIPDQKRKINVRKLAMGSLASMKPSKGGFQPARLVANFELYDEDQPEGFLVEFDQPFELRVRYTKADLQHAERDGAPLALAFWDGTTWVRFTAEKHGFNLQPDADPKNGGFGVVSISRWGDPPVSWGK